MSKTTVQKLSLLFISLALTTLGSVACSKYDDSPEGVEKKRQDEAQDAIDKYCDRLRDCDVGGGEVVCSGTILQNQLSAIHKQHLEEAYKAALDYLRCFDEVECTAFKQGKDPCKAAEQKFDELATKIKCADGKIVEGEYCNESKECEDGSDEANEHCFACNDTMSIPRYYVCDGDPDCPVNAGDVSLDEADCPKK